MPAVFLSRARGAVPVVKRLQSTISGQIFPFERIEEFAGNGESLEVGVEGLASARVKPGRHLRERFADALPVACGREKALGSREDRGRGLRRPHAHGLGPEGHERLCPSAGFRN